MGVGRDVCRVDGADRRDHAKTAGIRRFTGDTVAGGAVAKLGKVGAPRDQFRRRGRPGELLLPRIPVCNIGYPHRRQETHHPDDADGENAGLPPHAGTRGPGDLR